MSLSRYGPPESFCSAPKLDITGMGGRCNVTCFFFIVSHIPQQLPPFSCTRGKFKGSVTGKRFHFAQIILCMVIAYTLAN